MGGWARLCCLRLGTHFSSLFRERTSQSLCHDRVPTNIYYILSTTWRDESQDVDRKLLSLLTGVINSNRLIVYPLTKKDFEARLWQSSCRLVVLFANSGSEQNLPDGFSKEYSLISEFIADGGQVLLMLRKPASLSHLDANSLGKTLWSQSSISDTDLCSWRWRFPDRNAAQLSNKQPSDCPVLLGELLMDSGPRTSLAVLSVESDDSTPKGIRNALELLGIECAPTNDLRIDRELQPVNGTFSKPIPLYSLILKPEQHALLDSIFPPDKVLHLKDTTHFKLHTFTDADKLPAGFAWKDYVDTLQTEKFGRTLLWTESMGSSWDFCLSLVDNLPANSGLLVVSNQQTCGKGRGDNKWISPIGQACFTFHITLTNPSPYDCESQRSFSCLVTCLQHLVALSVVLACRQLIADSCGNVSTDEEFLSAFEHPGSRILIKWPNDVYVAERPRSIPVSSGDTYSTAGKLAGVLTRCTSMTMERATFVIGVGLNVSNELPTVCLQDVLNSACSPVSTNVLSSAHVIATVMNRLESLLNRVLHTSTNSGLNWAMNLYTSCWIHSNQSLTIERSPQSDSMKVSPVRCTVTGVDSFGYLRVRDLTNGTEYSLHPDGNSMDMMRGLIIPK